MGSTERLGVAGGSQQTCSPAGPGQYYNILQYYTIISQQYKCNIITSIIFQGGILNYKESSVWYMTPTSQDTAVEPLAILHISGILGIWVIGCSLGILTFMVELCTGKGQGGCQYPGF